MSDTKSAQEQTTTEVSMMKTSLRTHFARLLDDELDVDEVTNWFASLGMVTGKQDITENAAALTHYFDDLGFNTGLKLWQGCCESAAQNHSKSAGRISGMCQKVYGS